MYTENLIRVGREWGGNKTILREMSAVSIPMSLEDPSCQLPDVSELG
jgi:hypothetical protein